MIIHLIIRWLQHQFPGEVVNDLLDNDGQGLVEYALILVLVGLVVLVLIYIYGPAVGNLFSNIVANF